MGQGAQATGRSRGAGRGHSPSPPTCQGRPTGRKAGLVGHSLGLHVKASGLWPTGREKAAKCTVQYAYLLPCAPSMACQKMLMACVFATVSDPALCIGYVS
jgi:hypothetical protein